MVSVPTNDEIETLHVSDRKEWRKWLKLNFENKLEIWLVYPRKYTGKPRIIYNDAVEEALCFGWIDSILKKLDEDHSMQRFTPRNPKSKFSQPNKERLMWLKRENLLHLSVISTVDKLLKDPFIFPEDILDIIEQDSIAYDNYKAFSDAYQRIRIAYIDSARNRPEEFQKRLNNFIKKCRVNKQIGFGGIEKYY